MNISKNLAYYRKEYNYTQEQVAELCDVSRQAYAKWESGESFPSLDKLITLSEIYNISIDSLLTGKASIDPLASIRDKRYEQAKKEAREIFMKKHEGVFDVDATDIDEVKGAYFDLMENLAVSKFTYTSLLETNPQTFQEKEFFLAKIYGSVSVISDCLEAVKSTIHLN